MRNGDKLFGLIGEDGGDRLAAALEALLETVLETVRADEGSILGFDPARRRLVFRTTVGKNAKDLAGKTVPLGCGVTGAAALLREIQIGSKLAPGKLYGVADDGEPFSVLAAPLLCDDELLGVMTAVRFAEGAVFNSSDAIRCAGFARVASELVRQGRRIALLSGTADEDTLDSRRREELDLLRRFNRLTARHPDKTAVLRKFLECLEELGD